MNIRQINYNDIFIKDNEQIIKKNLILNKYPDKTIKFTNNYDERPIINWFSNKLNKKFDNLEQVARNISEDICIVKKINGEYIMVAGLVAFLNRWRLEEKINQNLEAIHKPIPNMDKVLRVINKFFDMIKENVPYRRTNWGFVHTDQLYLPYDIETDKSIIYERIETQTIIKVQNQIIFLIKTDLYKSSKDKLLEKTKYMSKELINYKLLNSKL